MNTLGVDPGREKVGLALVDESGAIVWRAIVEPANLRAKLGELFSSFAIERVALGDSTASDFARAQLETTLQTRDSKPAIQIVDERNSTLEARELYWRAHPPRGWRKIIPRSMQVPPEPIDDFAAAVIARRVSD